MFNLIPENLRAHITKEYNLRRIILSLVFFIFVQAAFLVFIFPTWIISGIKEQSISVDVDVKNQRLSALNIASTTDDIKKLNDKISVIDSSLQYPEAVPYVNNILSKKTKSIKINSISYVISGKKSASIDIAGVSATRESLTSFVKGLESLGLFKNVNLPISNFAKDKDLAFTINLTIQLQ